MQIAEITFHPETFLNKDPEVKSQVCNKAPQSNSTLKNPKSIPLNVEKEIIQLPDTHVCQNQLNIPPDPDHLQLSGGQIRADNSAC